MRRPSTPSSRSSSRSWSPSWGSWSSSRTPSSRPASSSPPPLAALVFAAAAALLPAALPGCRCFLPEFGAARCDESCPAGEECYLGYCIPATEAGPTDSGPVDTDGGQPGDTDGDLQPDDVDNCPTVANPNQENTYGLPDAEGDACDDTDGDDSVDAVDCAPEDMTVFPGNEDPCDGVVDSDCRAACTIAVGGLVRDVAGSTSGRIGYSVAGAAPSFATFDGFVPAGPGSVVLQADPRAVAVNPAPSHDPVAADRFYVTDPMDAGAAVYNEAASLFFSFPVAGAGGAMAMSPFGEIAVVALASANALFAFDPCDTPGTPADCFEESGNATGAATVTIDLGTTFSLDPAWRPSALAFRPAPALDGFHVAFVAFAGRPEVVLIRLDVVSVDVITTNSGPLDTGGNALTVSSLTYVAGDRLLFTTVDDTGAAGGELRVTGSLATTATAAFLAATPVPAGAAPSCPSHAILDGAGALWLADRCNDVVWQGTLDPSGTATFATAHPTCPSPSRLATVSPAAGTDLIYVACDGFLGVLGVD